jgi:hypothetical protein
VERCYRQASKHLHAAEPADVAALVWAWGQMGYVPRDRLFLNQVGTVLYNTWYTAQTQRLSGPCEHAHVQPESQAFVQLCCWCSIIARKFTCSTIACSTIACSTTCSTTACRARCDSGTYPQIVPPCLPCPALLLLLPQVKIISRRAFDAQQLSGLQLVQLMHGLARMPKYAPNAGWLLALCKQVQPLLQQISPGACACRKVSLFG